MARDFGYTAEHDLLRTTARRVLEERSPLTRVRALVDDERGYDGELAAEIAELGWCGIVVPQEHGGAGLDYLSMALVLEECGRVLLPGPFFGNVLATVALDCLASDEQRGTLLPALAEGTTTATVALSGGAHVLWAAEVDTIIAPIDGGYYAVPSAALACEREVGVDTTRRGYRVALTVGDGAVRLAGDDAAWARFRARARALLAAEMVGAAEKILCVTRDYAIERVQFKRQIGSFQAVKHPLVDVMIAVEKARSLVYASAAAIDGDDPELDLLSRAAKVAAEGALSYAADRGVQFHGGYGFTWDCDAHFFMKRALWSAATLGDARHHRRVIGDALAEAKAP